MEDPRDEPRQDHAPEGAVAAALSEELDPNAEVPSEEGKKTTQYMAALFATLGAMAAGTVLAWTSPTLPELQSANSTLPITPEEGSWVGSLMAIGAIAGALPAGFFAEKFGRKLVICSLSAPFLLSWIMIIFAGSVALLYIARIVAGVATGAICVVAPMYIGEIAENSVRGALGSYFQVMLTVGILYTYIFGAVADYTWLGILSAVVPVVFVLLFWRMPESPAYLMKKYRTDEARRSLQYFRGPLYNVRKEIEDLEIIINESSKQQTSLKDLVSSPATRKALIISLGLMIFQQLSGVNAVIFYTVKIFDAAGSTLDPKYATIIVGVVQTIFTYVASLIVDRAGRRILLLTSSSVMGLCLAVLGLYFHLKDNGSDVSGIGWLPLVCVNVFIVVFSLGFGPIPWMMTGELFAANIKGTASSIAVCTNWTLVFIVTFSFEKLLNALGTNVTFWIFAVICGLASAFVFILVPETKGKSLSEIQQMLSGKSPRKANIV
ncbi:Facilitated trehalose transporter Tret1 [Blattella germanica]|nr:Facilitated trehalose transporter Tret1 [Blattella germanica]